MKLAQSRVTAQGQVSVPAEVRKRLGLGPGAVMEWETDGDAITIRRVGRFTSSELHAAIFPVAPKARTLAELKTGIRLSVQARHAKR